MTTIDPKPKKATKPKATNLNEQASEPKTTKVTASAKEVVANASADTKPAPAGTDSKNSTVSHPKVKHGKNYRKSAELVDPEKKYLLTEAVSLAKKTSLVKFDASLEIHINLGVDPKLSDQLVRGSVILPAGTGKTLKVAVVCGTSLQAGAKTAGADIVGGDELIEKIEKGQMDFDVLIASPDMMPKLGKIAKILGPKGLMPNPKTGTVTADVARAVSETKAGRVEYKIDKQAIVHQAIGKVSFKEVDLLANASALIQSVHHQRPESTKGTYIQSISIATTMGPGIKVDTSDALSSAAK